MAARRFRSPRILVVAVALAVILVAGVATLTLTGGESDARDQDFRIEDGRLVRPNGKRFVIRGVVLPYGTFAGGPGAGQAALNYARIDQDVKRVRAEGANLVRVFVTPDTLEPRRFTQLERVVRAARAQRLVVQISASFRSFAETRPLVRRLAERWAGNPRVWIQPMNEPQCTNPVDNAAGRCEAWRLWRRQHTAYLRTIRAAGVTSPVVVNAPAFSTDMRPLARYRLKDRQVLYGAHRYGNTNASFDGRERARVEEVIGVPSRRLPIFIDEIGNFNGPQFPNAVAWSAGMAGWAAEWTRRGDGNGATGFNWRWSDANTMIGPDERLTAWGQAFVRAILNGLRPER